jgi:hypothetical protein
MECRTRRGVMHLAGGDALVQPVELFIAGLDVLLGKLQARLDLSLIQAISGGAHVRSSAQPRM